MDRTMVSRKDGMLVCKMGGVQDCLLSRTPAVLCANLPSHSFAQSSLSVLYAIQFGYDNFKWLMVSADTLHQFPADRP